jgi:hypothetical protein
MISFQEEKIGRLFDFEHTNFEVRRENPKLRLHGECRTVASRGFAGKQIAGSRRHGPVWNQVG